MEEPNVNDAAGRPFKIDLDTEPQRAPRPPKQPKSDAGGGEGLATRLIIAVNFIVFGLMVTNSGGQAFLSPSQELLLKWGADYGPLALNGEAWRIFTSMFVHIGIVHIGMNMYILWDVGTVLERLFGTSKFLVIYILAGLGGAVASLHLNPLVLSAGASGAVFGSFGALLAIFRGHSKSFNKLFVQSATRSVVFLLVFNLLWGLSQKGIDNAAHIGGFFTGLVAGFMLLPQTLGDKRWSVKNVMGALILLGLIGFVFHKEQITFSQLNPRS